MPSIRIALIQCNPCVGAIRENRALIEKSAREALAGGAQVLLFPECVLSGYPPEDLVQKRHFIAACEEHLDGMAATLPPEALVLVGSPTRGGQRPRNSAILYFGGERMGQYDKQLLPNYGVFDEKRVFEPGDKTLLLDVGGVRLGLNICEDSWVPEGVALQGLSGQAVDGVLNLSASPYHREKYELRLEALRQSCQELDTSLLYCNLVGGQDELVFDGGSMVLGSDGKICARARNFETDILYYDLASKGGAKESTAAEILRIDLPQMKVEPTPPRREPLPCDLEEVYGALCLGLRDYTDKNRFKDVVIAISGGIDSALVAAIAVDALGAKRVSGITMPSQYSSDETRGDAYALAENLGIAMHTLPIGDLFGQYLDQLHPLWPEREPDVTEENIQARIRGNLIMAYSNKFGSLVLTTGNKSELATGYCTLYGDMAGGFAVIKDVPKMLVFALSRWRNESAGREVIPTTTIERPPSAELRPDQKDSDSLPPYEELDPIIEAYVEDYKGFDEMVAEGHAPDRVRQVIHLVDLNEYKRRQAPPGVKITPRAFGRDRRMPITNHFRYQL